MNVLLIHSFTFDENKKSVFNAISYHRVVQPHRVLSRVFPEIDCIHSPTCDIPDELLDQVDMVLFLRYIQDPEFAVKLKKKGIPFGVDTDDYWFLPKEHIAYPDYQKNDLTTKIIASLQVADFVTCTTTILRDKIYELNKNVYIIENGIDTLDVSWQPNKIKSDRIRFGFLQGSTHKDDIYMINHDVQKALRTDFFKQKGQVVLPFKFGQSSIQVAYEKMLTDYLEVFDKEHRKELFENKANENRPYKRIEYQTTEKFGQLYNEFDISVCPLVKNEFNSCKSELKMLEAGFMDCAVMVSDVSPYKEIATSENSFLFSDKDFYYWSRYIINNPNCVEDKKAALKETVKRYDLNLLAEKRKDIYEFILTNKKKECLV